MGVPDHGNHAEPLCEAYQGDERFVRGLQEALEVGGLSYSDWDLLGHSVAQSLLPPAAQRVA